MGANPNVKGAGGEMEITNILKAHGYEAGRTGQWKKLDVWWSFLGIKRMLEVKRRKRAWTQIYKAFKEDAWFIGREDHGQWFIAMPMMEYLNQNKSRSNIGHQESPSPTVGSDMEASIEPGTHFMRRGS